jgi:hypothetical protein
MLVEFVVIQKEAYFSLFLRGYKRLYIQHEVQVDFQSTWSSYRWTGIISDVAASFLSSNCLISQQFSSRKGAYSAAAGLAADAPR